MIYQVDKETFQQHSELFDGVKIINSFGCIHIITDDSYYCDICTMLGFDHVKPERALSLTKINKTLVDVCLPYITQNLAVYCSFIIGQYERINVSDIIGQYERINVSDIITATENGVLSSEIYTTNAVTSPFIEIVQMVAVGFGHPRDKLVGIDIDAEYINKLCEYYSNDYHLVAVELTNLYDEIIRIRADIKAYIYPPNTKGKNILTDLENQLYVLKKKFVYAVYN